MSKANGWSGDPNDVGDKSGPSSTSRRDEPHEVVLREEMVSALISKMREVEDHGRAIGANPAEIIEAVGYYLGEVAAGIALAVANQPQNRTMLREQSYANAFHRNAVEHLCNLVSGAYKHVIEAVVTARQKKTKEPTA